MKKQMLLGVSALTFATVSFAGGPDIKASKNILPPKAARPHCINSINAAGHFTLTLHQATGKACFSIRVRHAPDNSVRRYFRHNNLYISSDNKRAQVVVYTHAIRNLNAYTHVTVTGDQFNAHQPLSLSASGKSSIQLKGQFNLAQIIQNSSRPISITWANSDTIAVNGAGNGPIQLAGVTQQLRASLHNNSRLNAEYLRANKVWVKTSNNASAKVTATDSLRAFAHNNSNIYFYKQPTHITRQSTGSANVLQLGWHQ